MRNSTVAFFSFLILTTGIAFATGLPEEESTVTEEAIVVTDALGRSVELSEPPQRIVLAGRAVLMIADAVYAFPGAGSRVVGVGRIDQGRGNFLRALDPRYGEKTILERNVGPEQVAALSPDLVIIKTFMRETLGRGLEEIGVPVIYVELETPEQYARDLVTIGSVLGEPERAEELVAYFDRERERIESAVANVPPASKPRVLFAYVRPDETGLAFDVPPPGWIQTGLVHMAAGDPLWARDVTGRGWIRVNLEQVVRWNPEVLFVVSYRNDIGAIVERLQADPLFTGITAFSEGRVYPVPVDYYSWDQPDVRWILGLTWMAQTLHPDRFEGDYLESALYRFFQTVYAMDRAETDRIIVPLLGDALETR